MRDKGLRCCTRARRTISLALLFFAARFMVASPATNVAPSLAYSTFLGSAAFDQGIAVALDPQGNAYVTGSTLANGTEDAFLLKVTSDGQKGSLWYTLGGSGPDRGLAIAVDAQNNVWVVGTTASADFYRTNALQTSLHGVSDLFVFKIGPPGNPVFSTYLGGNSSEPDLQIGSVSLALDATGNAYIASTTRSTDFPTTPGSFQPKIKDDFPIDQFTYTDLTVTKISPEGKILYSTYIGGNGNDAAYGVAVDRANRAWITGATTSPDFPLKHPLGSATNPGTASFLCRLSADGSALEYSTYLPVSLSHAISLDGAGNIYLTGYTTGNLPTTADAVQPNPSDNRSQDAFLLKLSPDGSSVMYATYLGGNGDDEGLSVAANPAGYVTVAGLAGFTPFKNFPTLYSLQPYRNNTEGFVAKFAPDSTILYSTYLGGNGNDQANGVALDSFGNVFVTGATESSDFPLQNALRPDYLNGEAFLSKITDIPASDSAAGNLKTFSNYGFTPGLGGFKSFQMDILVPPFYHYYLQRSTNLLTWDTETLFEAGADGTFHYSDEFATSYARKFYRVIVNTNFSGGGKN